MARETFQTRLKRAMESAGLKQVDLVRIAAERGAKLGKSQVSQYVSGKVTPRRDVMELLAGVLGVTPQWLMGAADAMPDDVAPADVAPEVAAPQAPSTSRQKKTDQGSVTMREFKKSNKLDNVLYDVRGPVVDEAARMEEDGARILKLNIGNPAPFGFRAPDEVVYDMRQQLTDCEGYSDSRGLFAARKAIMQYAQLRNIPNVDMKHIYTGNGVSELIQLSMHALVDDGDEVLIPSPDYPLWTACVTLAGGHAVHYVCDEQNEWNPDLADMESKVTSRTKAIVVINPNNPTGAVYSKEVLEGIVEIARNGETAATVAQYIMPIANRKKQELLEAVLNDKGHERVIVFARTKNRTEECAEALEAAGFHAESIHSDKTQGRRRRALENFRRGKTDILVATDVLARGIDVPEVNYVINFDLPDMAEDYVHRIGRTGRAGEEGFAISFVTRETMKTLKEIEKLIGKDIPFTTIEGYETDPSVLEKPKRGERKGGTRRGGNKPAGARRTGEKHAERAEREGRRPNAGEGHRRREDDSLVTRGERGGRGGKGRFDRKGRNDRGGRFDRDNRNDRGGNKGGHRGKGGAGRNGEWLSDEEFRSRRNAKNAQARLHKKERKAQNGNPHKTNNKKRGGEGGYDYSRFSK